MKTITNLVAVFLIGVLNLPAQSVPPLINYQGQLLNADGTPMPTADYQLTFNIFGQGGNLIWGPQIFDGQSGLGHGPKIPVVNGYFNVSLGPTDTTGRQISAAFATASRFIEITVSNQPINPRQEILSAPFAFKAANADKLAGHDWSSLLVAGNDPVTGHIKASKLEPITRDQIADKAITTAQIADNAIATAQIKDGTITAQDIQDSSISSAKLAPLNVLTISNRFNTAIQFVDAGTPLAESPNFVARVFPFNQGFGSELYLNNARLLVPGTLSGTGSPLYMSSSGQIFRGTSSARHKENVGELTTDFQKILALQPKKFTRKGNPEEWEIGYLAEDVDASGLEGIAVYDEQGRPDAIDYSKIVVYLNEILKQQHAALKAQREELSRLRLELSQLAESRR